MISQYSRSSDIRNMHCDEAGARRPFKRPQLRKPGRQRWHAFVRFLLTLIFALSLWSANDDQCLMSTVKKRSIAHKKFNITDQTSIQHLQTFSIIKDSWQCTDIDLMMYRNGTSHVPKSYYKNTCTEIDLICTEVIMYRSRHVPKLSTPLFRNCYVPKAT